MYEGRSVAVIIPAYNEEAHVAEVIDSVPAFVDRVYAIDDASDDATWSTIQAIARRINRESSEQHAGFPERIVPIRHEENRGAGGTVITGYRHALADRIDVTAVMDGDGQMDPTDLDRIVAPVATGQVEYAKGNRLHQRTDWAAMSRWRLFGNALLTMLTRAASGYWDMSDPQNGYTAISMDALGDLPLDRLYQRYGFLNDVLVQLNCNREPIADVSHEGKYGEETSGIRYRQFIPGLSALLAKRFTRRITRMYLVQKFHPLVLGYLLGPIVILTGMLGLGSAAAGIGDGSLTAVLLGGTLSTLGVTLLVLAIAYDVQENEGLVYREDDRSPVIPVPPRPHQSDQATVELASDGGERENLPAEPDESSNESRA